MGRERWRVGLHDGEERWALRPQKIPGVGAKCGLPDGQPALQGLADGPEPRSRSPPKTPKIDEITSGCQLDE